MFKTLREKISRFAASHPRVMTYGIAMAVRLRIALAASFAMNQHEALAADAPGNNVTKLYFYFFILLSNSKSRQSIKLNY
jgi:hypothetical protein